MDIASNTGHPLSILVLPDVQAAPGQDFRFLSNIGRYMVKKKPDVVVCLGDFADFPSLSSYDKGKKSFEGRRYKEDVKAVHRAMDALFAPYRTYVAEMRKKKKRPWRPRQIMCLGNHCDRLTRAIEDDAKLEGAIGLEDLKYEEYGWEVYPFLDAVEINGVFFVHYVPAGRRTLAVSTPAALLAKKHASIVCGHQQGRSLATTRHMDGRTLTALIVGSCYEVDQPYMSKNDNRHWRGIVMLHDVKNGEFVEVCIPLSYLAARYGKSNSWK